MGMCRHWQDSFDAQHIGNCRWGDCCVHNHQSQFLHRCSITSAYPGECTRKEIRCNFVVLISKKRYLDKTATHALQLHVRIHHQFETCLYLSPISQVCKWRSREMSCSDPVFEKNLNIAWKKSYTKKIVTLTAKCSTLQITKDSLREVHYRSAAADRDTDVRQVLPWCWLLSFIWWLFYTPENLFTHICYP